MLEHERADARCSIEGMLIAGSVDCFVGYRPTRAIMQRPDVLQPNFPATRQLQWLMVLLRCGLGR